MGMRPPPWDAAVRRQELQDVTRASSTSSGTRTNLRKTGNARRKTPAANAPSRQRVDVGLRVQAPPLLPGRDFAGMGFKSRRRILFRVRRQRFKPVGAAPRLERHVAVEQPAL